MAADAKKETRWYTGEVQHEGLPLHLRFPEKPDFESLARKFPKLLVIKHTLAKVKSSGVPEPDYNDSLTGFDQELVTAFERTASGSRFSWKRLGDGGLTTSMCRPAPRSRTPNGALPPNTRNTSLTGIRETMLSGVSYGDTLNITGFTKMANPRLKTDTGNARL
jgi:hypothetical protein